MAKPNTYSQISMHFVFAVKHRKALILPEFKDRLMYYIHRIIVNKDQKPLAINGTCDHIHLFIGLSPAIYIPDLIRDIKSDSSQFINQNKLSTERFQWQEGYGAF